MHDPNGTKQSFMDYLEERTNHLEINQYLISCIKGDDSFTIYVYDTSKKDENGCDKTIGLVTSDFNLNVDLDMCFTTKITTAFDDTVNHSSLTKWKKAVEKKIKSEVNWEAFNLSA